MAHLRQVLVGHRPVAVPGAARRGDARRVEVERARRLVEDPHPGAPVGLLLGVSAVHQRGLRRQIVTADEVLGLLEHLHPLHRLVHQPGDVVEHPLGRRGDHDVDPRPPELASGNHLDVDHLAAGVPDGARAEKMEDLRFQHPLVPHRLGAPDHERHLLRIPPVLGDVVLQQPLGEEDAEVPRGRLRHLVGIDAVEVLARGIGVRVADGLAAVPRRDVAAAERVQQVVELARTRFDDPPLHVRRRHRRVVRQQIPVDRHDRLHRAGAHLRPRRAAEGMQAVRDVLPPQLDQVVLDGVQRVVLDLRAGPQVQTQVLDHPELDRLPAYLVRVRLGELHVLVDVVVIVVDALAERGQLRQQAALDERRHHVIHQRGHAATARHQSLAHDVDVVDVQVRQVGDQRIRGVGRGQPEVLAVEPLEGPVRSQVDDGIGPETQRLRRPQPGVGRDVLVMRRQIPGVIQLLAVLAPPARRLRQHRDVAEAQGRDDQAAVLRHQRRVLRSAPVGDHLLPQLRRVAVEPAQIVAHPGPRGAAPGQHRIELARGVTADVPRPGGHPIEERAGRQIDVASSEVVAGRPHAPKDVGQRLGHVEVARADAGLARRVVVEEDGHPLVGVRYRRERRVTERPPHRRRDAGGDWLTGDDGQPRVRIGTALLAPHHRGRHQSRQLRDGDLESPLEHGQPLRRGAPLGLAPTVEADQAEDGDIELPQRLAGVGAGETEQERQRDVGPRRAVRIAEQRLERDAGRITEDRDRLGALPLDLGDDRIDERGVAVVVVRSVEADRHARRPRPALAGRSPPGIERLPGSEHAAARAARAPGRSVGIRVVVACLRTRPRLWNGETRHAGGRQRVLEQPDLVGEARVFPERPCPAVPGYAALDVMFPRQQSLTDPEDQPLPGDPADEVHRMGLVEPLERVLIVDVQDEHVALQHLLRIDVVEQRFGHETDGDAVPQVRMLDEHRLPRAQQAGQGGIAREVREADLLGVGGTDCAGRQQGDAGQDAGGSARGSPGRRAPPRMCCCSHAIPLSRARRRSVRRPGDRRCRGAHPARRASRRSARTP